MLRKTREVPERTVGPKLLLRQNRKSNSSETNIFTNPEVLPHKELKKFSSTDNRFVGRIKMPLTMKFS